MAALLMCSVTCVPVHERRNATPAQSVSVPPAAPAPPFAVSYEVWDHHFIQWLGPATPYETVELCVKELPGRQRLWLFLTERAQPSGSKGQIHYTNDPDLAQTLRQAAGDRQVVVSEIRYTRLESVAATLMDVSIDAPEGPLSWHFESQGQPDPDRGGRLIDAAEAAHDLSGGLLLFYLEASALSGRGTHFRLGSHEESVQPWTALSRPPHFEAFRAVYSRPAHVGYFPTLTPIDVELVDRRVGPPGTAQWSYRQHTGSGADELMRVALTVRGEDWVFASGSIELHTRREVDRFATTALVARDGSRAMTLHFDPPIPDLLRMPLGTSWSRFTLEMAGVAKLVSGRVTISRRAEAVELRLLAQDPPWAAELPFATTVQPLGAGYRYQSRSTPANGR